MDGLTTLKICTGYKLGDQEVVFTKSLAREVAMSRSGFAARFTELVGEPAMQYVTRWRMHVALTWLRADEAALSELAGRLGYQSEAAFSRAFKRFMGISPGAARRRAQC